MTFLLTVPGTDTRLQELDGCLVSGDATFCATSAGIWDLVSPDRRTFLDDFAAAYAAVRAAEDRSMTPAEIRKLPYVRPDHPLASMWEQRAASHQRFVDNVADIAATQMIDIGAGCGWLAADLARRGWQCAAVDVTVDGGDGLAEARHHDADLFLVRAEMEALPFASSSVGLAVFNASLHYASNVRRALHEAARVVRSGGHVVVLDSPIFTNPDAGAAMVRELAAHLHATVGAPPAEHEGPGFVAAADIDSLPFRRVRTSSVVRERLHRLRGRRRAGRETASRPLLIATIGDPS